jgi:hypothetical protein
VEYVGTVGTVGTFCSGFVQNKDSGELFGINKDLFEVK